jgi:inorganic triphosphatase YgiF
VDTYVDTEDRRLDRAGYSVRLRRESGRPAEATLKSLASDDSPPDGPRVRLELAEELDVDDPSAIADAEGPVGERVRALAGGSPLLPLFDVETRRLVFPLSAGEVSSGELLLDDTAIREPGGKLLRRLRRVEVEVPEEAVPFVQGLVERLRSAFDLQPAVLSKYETGLAAAGLTGHHERTTHGH